MNIIILGPRHGTGGISAVIDTIVTTDIWSGYTFVKIDTSVYKNGGMIKEVITFAKALIKFIYFNITKEIDIVHIHSSFKYSFFRKSAFTLISRLFDRKVVFHLHASDFYSFFIKQKSKIVKKFISFILKKNDVNIVLCSDWKDKLHDAFGLSNVVVIRNPSPNTALHRKNEFVKDEINFLFMGFYIPSKGVMDLIEAAFLLKKQNFRNFTLTLCGKREMEREIDLKVENYGLNGNIINKGWVSAKEKEDCFNRADVLVLPSYKEGMPMVILEAFSYGLPVISTKISGIPEIIKHEQNGFLIRPGDIEDLVKYMKILMQDATIRKEISEDNIRHVKYFHPRVVADEWKRVYNDCVKFGGEKPVKGVNMQ